MATKKSIKGTQTEKNLVIAYIAESTAYTKYIFYAERADKEEYYPIGEIFRSTAANELRHAKVFLKHLKGGQIDVQINPEAGTLGDTLSNLELAAEEERRDGVEMYTEAAKIAKKEGFPEIAVHFAEIAEVEMRHLKRFQAYIEQVKNGSVWKRDHDIVWQCLVCGYNHKGKKPPKECPACDHPYKHYIGLDMDEL